MIAAPFTNASMIILLDNEEYMHGRATDFNDFGALSQTLIVALEDNIAPIIVSASLLKHVFINEEIIAQKSIYNPKQKESKWIYKEISDQLYLLIPRFYNNIPELKRYQRGIIKTQDDLTDLELKLGLKIDHLKIISRKDILQKQIPDLYNFDEDFINGLPKVFVLNSDYAVQSMSPLQWAIFMSGRGYYYTFENNFYTYSWDPKESPTLEMLSSPQRITENYIDSWLKFEEHINKLKIAIQRKFR